MKSVFATLLIVWLAGCTFQSSQLNGLKGMFNKPAPSPVHWQARYGNTIVPVIAITQEPFIVFANSDDVAIAFDGWQVRSVVGFNLPVPLKIRYEDGSPQFSGPGSARSASEVHQCEPWAYTATEAGGEWLQRCKADFYYQNVITLDAQRAIRRISQVVDGSGTRLILEKI